MIALCSADVTTHINKGTAKKMSIENFNGRVNDLCMNEIGTFCGLPHFFISNGHTWRRALTAKFPQTIHNLFLNHKLKV